MTDTKLKLKNISKKLSSLEAASRIIVQCQSGLSGQRVFYIEMRQRFEMVACLVQTMQRVNFEVVFSTNLSTWQQMLDCSGSLGVEGVYTKKVLV